VVQGSSARVCECALRRECIAPEGSDRSNHRQDQAVLTILYCKYQEKYKFSDINEKIDLIIHSELKNFTIN